MLIITWFISALYYSLVIAFLVTWLKIKREKKGEVPTKSFINFSIIIPVRNEEENILPLLTDISRQNYPKENFEVIIVNDNSTDATVEKVTEFINFNSNFYLKHLQTEAKLISYKKKALEIGITCSTGDTIISTDGDCRVKENWLLSINEFMQSKNAVSICGPVTYIDDKAFFTALQIIEFSALLGSGASTIAMGLPGMCNGANFIYKKDAFFEVEGFKNINSIASGDDELLMHKLIHKYPGRVFFLKNDESIVYTKANKGLKEFFHQRKRWASKWGHYNSLVVKSLAIFIFIANLYFASGPLLIFSGVILWKHFILQFMLKMVVEGFFITQILIFLKKKIHLIHLLFLQIVYPFYTSFIGIVANFGGYVWKDRKVK